MTEEQRARFREDRILISWRVPDPGLVRLRGAVQSYEVIVRQVPLACLECRPQAAQHIVLNRDSPDLTVENPTVYYQYAPQGPPAQWLIQVQTRFQSGNSRLGNALLVAESNETPVHSFSFEAIKSTLQVRLFWQPRQARVVHIVTPEGGHYDRPVFYRANVYRRLPPAPWPLSPLNSTPLDTVEYLVQPPASGARGGPDLAEYTIRLVDEFGNEGPAAPPLRFGPGSGGKG
ncbi:MAG: hypothetical protein ACHQZQ_01340 [SAR324 cluster bacterium]